MNEKEICMTMIILKLFYLPIRSQLLGMKCIEHQYLQIFGFKLNKYE